MFANSMCRVGFDVDYWGTFPERKEKQKKENLRAFMQSKNLFVYKCETQYYCIAGGFCNGSENRNVLVFVL